MSLLWSYINWFNVLLKKKNVWDTTTHYSLHFSFEVISLKGTTMILHIKRSLKLRMIFLKWNLPFVLVLEVTDATTEAIMTMTKVINIPTTIDRLYLLKHGLMFVLNLPLFWSFWIKEIVEAQYIYQTGKVKIIKT